MRKTPSESRKLVDENPFSLSLGDLMAGLLLIFVLLLSFVMLNLSEQEDRLVEIVKAYMKLREDLYFDLKKEFEKDLEKWQAVLDKEKISIRFKEPEVLFEPGKAEVRPQFQGILDDFFPRYVRILRDSKYINDLAEIRIEGHTSSEWIGEKDKKVAYIRNMELSQDRTRNVLQYVLDIPGISEKHKEWLKQYLTANGLSSSKLIKSITIANRNEDQGKSGHHTMTTWGTIKTHIPKATTTWGTIRTRLSKEIPEESRRVEFRVRTNAEKQLDKLLDGNREYR